MNFKLIRKTMGGRFEVYCGPIPQDVNSPEFRKMDNWANGRDPSVTPTKIDHVVYGSLVVSHLSEGLYVDNRHARFWLEVA